MIKNKEEQLLLKLNTPQKIQEFLELIPFNHERRGETCQSAYQVISTRTAHCLEGAFLACAALVVQKRKPHIISLKVTNDDYDHVITIYRENGYFGAISKTNHAVLGWRDPVYRTTRELVMSYFHEYFLTSNGKKTLRGYTKIIPLTRFGNSWIFSQENLFTIAQRISCMPIVLIIPKENKKFIRVATALERKAASISRDGKL